MRILILGGSGMLGHKLCAILAERADVWATFRNDPTRSPFLSIDKVIAHVDAQDFPRIKEVLDSIRPDAVVNAIGIVKQSSEASQAVLTIRVNSLFPHLLAELCLERGIRLIHFSTDCVFSGTRGNYTEHDHPDPVDLYGRSKLLGEVNSPGVLTLRTSAIGWQINTFTGLLSWFAHQRGKLIKGYRNAIFSGLSTTGLSQLTGDILFTDDNLSGIYHVATEPISKYDLLLKLRELLSWRDIVIDPEESFICNRSLSAARFARDSGWRSPSWDSMLEGLAVEWLDYQKYYPG